MMGNLHLFDRAIISLQDHGDKVNMTIGSVLPRQKAVQPQAFNAYRLGMLRRGGTGRLRTGALERGCWLAVRQLSRI